MISSRTTSAYAAAAGDFTAFKRILYRRYEHAPHLAALDRALVNVLRYAETGGASGIGRLIVEMPPRHGKTVTTSRLFPSWALGRNPDMRVMLVSYAATLAEKNSRAARNLIASPYYQAIFPDIALAADSASVDHWNLANHEGGADALGIGGSATGMGAHLLIIDDPIKNRAEAESALYRDRVYDAFTDDLYTRLEPSGAVILMMCMTGDTPVLMADGSEHPLREIKVGDRVATYDQGKLRTSTVLNHKSNGRDAVYKITMTSGKIVRANERHPFLVEEHGEPKWIRLKHLTTEHRIVTVRGNGESGKARPAALKDVNFQSHAVAIAPRTTERNERQTAIVHLHKARKVGASDESRTAMALPLLNMTQCLKPKAESALFVGNHPEIMYALTGAENCASITITRQTQYALSYATTVTLPLVTPRTNQLHLQLSNTSDFTSEAIVSIEPDGIEEVFDVQIERTENFIANGLVSHNTRWHADDLVARVLKNMPGQWKRLRLPALAEASDALHRPEGAALWPTRFDVATLRSIERTLGPYSFAALYQQRPVPGEGGLFKRQYFGLLHAQPPPMKRKVRYWDLAMSGKTSADYTAGVLMGMDENAHRWVLDVERGHIDWGDLTEHMARVILQDGPEVTQGVEAAGYQSRAIQTLNADPRLRGYAIFPYTADKDKFTRALPAAAKAASGMLHIADRHWTAAFLEELCAFPNAAHDDQVDALSGAEAMLDESGALMAGAVNYADDRSYSAW